MLAIDLAFRNGKIIEIEQAGFEASLHHVALSENPYPEDSWEHEVWANGYASAERLDTPRYSAHH